MFRVADIVTMTTRATQNAPAGAGAGGVVGLRADQPHTWRSRALGVAVAVIDTFVLARTAGGIVLLSAPVFPFTAIGLAERRWERFPI